MKLKLILIFLLIGVVSNGYSQVRRLYGVIIDSETKQPISDAFIYTTGNDIHCHSDTKGKIKFLEIPSGSFEIIAEKAGYEKLIYPMIDDFQDSIFVQLLLIAKSHQLDEIPIAADKPVSAASSMYINQSTFANRPKNSAQDILRLVPGLFIAQHAGGGKAEQIFIRGFDCDHGTDIATFVDGMPVNMPSHGHGQGYADLHFLIPEIVDGMSVFKGTSSPLYGDFATGAAVNFKTLDSLQTNLIQVESGSVPKTNSLTSLRGLALISIPEKNDRVSSYFAVDLLSNKGFFEINQDFKRMNLFSKTTFYLSNTSKIQFTASGFGSSWNASGQIPERAVLQGIISRYGSIDSNEGGTTQRNNLNLVYTTKIGFGEFETQAYFSNYRFRLYSDFTFFLNDSINGDMIEQDDNRNVMGINAKYAINHHFFHLNNRFTFGVSFRSDEIQNQLWHAPHRERMKVNANALIHQRSNSLFLNEVFRFSKHLRLEAGLRYDYFIFDVEDLLPTDSIHQNYSGFNYQSALHPKLNLIYSVNDYFQLFFNTGTGFHSNDARSSVQDKLNHKLPLAASSEIGTLFNVKKTVVSIALWEMEMSNELVYVGDDGTTENKGSSRRLGVDMSLRSPITKWLYIDANLNYSKCRYTNTLFGSIKIEKFYIPLAPVLTSAGGLTSKFKFGLEMSLRYRYMMNRPANEINTIVAHGYQVVDFTANYKWKKFKFGFIIENLFNVKWNEAQFATQTKLKNESQPVEEIHFTPGTPFYAKISLGYLF